MKKIDNEQFDVFISYRRRNSTEVELIHADLAKDYKVFFDQNSIRTGTEYETKILSAIKNSKCLLVILTEDACRDFKEKKSKNEKDWVEEELSYAHEIGIPILPIVFYHEKKYSEVEGMIASLDECVPSKVASFLPKLQLFKVRLDYRTRISDLNSLKNEIEQFAIKRKVFKSIQGEKVDDLEDVRSQMKSLTKYLLLISFLAVLMSLFLWTKIWGEESNLSIKNVRLDSRVFVEKSMVDSIVSNPLYLQYKAIRRSDFDFRYIFYQEEVILPKTFDEKIQKDLEGYISFLYKKIEASKKELSKLSTYDDIETSTLFFTTLSGEFFAQELTASQQKVKLKSIFEEEILKVNKLIDELKNNIVLKEKQLLRIQVFNSADSDSLLSNTMQVKYKKNTYIRFRIKQPISHKKFLSIPVANGDTPEESYDKDDYRVIPKDSIVTQWYSLDQNVSLCSSGGDYEVVLYDNKTESISKIINCKEE